jgi:hypothetical protein
MLIFQWERSSGHYIVIESVCSEVLDKQRKKRLQQPNQDQQPLPQVYLFFLNTYF